MSDDTIRNSIRTYLLAEFLPGENPSELTDSTPLVTGGILDSIATMKFATFLENEFGIELQAHELSPDYIDTVETVVKLVQAKRRA